MNHHKAQPLTEKGQHGKMPSIQESKTRRTDTSNRPAT